MAGGATLNKLFAILLIPGGRVGVALFFMISGYFQIRKATASLKRVVGETLFYSVLLQLVALILKIGSLGNIARGFFPVASGSWWYVSSYVLLMICSPVINEYYLKLSEKQKRKVILLVWVFLYTMPYVLNLQYYSLERGVLFYLIGAYIRTEVDFEKVRYRRLQLVLAFAFLWMSYVPLGYMYYAGTNFNRHKEENPDHSCSVFFVWFASAFILASVREKIPGFRYGFHGLPVRSILWLL